MKASPSARGASSTGTYAAPAAACASEMLLLLARAQDSRSLAEIARSLGCSKSLAFRVSRELEARELIQRTESGRYRLGIAALEIGGAYAARAEYAETARAILRQLATETGETANLGVLRGPDVLCILKQEGENALGTFWNVGDRLPAHCTAIGKALLAELPRERVRQQLGPRLRPATSRSLKTYRELYRELDRVRKLGYAVARGEAIYGLDVVAVTARPPGLGGEPAAISLSMTEDRFRHREDEFVAILQRARTEIERETEGRYALANGGDFSAGEAVQRS